MGGHNANPLLYRTFTHRLGDQKKRGHNPIMVLVEIRVNKARVATYSTATGTGLNKFSFESAAAQLNWEDVPGAQLSQTDSVCSKTKSTEV